MSLETTTYLPLRTSGIWGRRPFHHQTIFERHRIPFGRRAPQFQWAGAGNVFPSGAKAATAPDPGRYTDAVRHKALTYLSIDQNLADMKGCLASRYPFVFGFCAYESIEWDGVAASGKISMPSASEQMIGGHAVRKGLRVVPGFHAGTPSS